MHCAIVANAPGFDARPVAARLRCADLLIAADGGGNPLFEAGLLPHLVVGDLDSLQPAALEHDIAAGAEILRYPAEKDETDLELGLLLAVQRGAVSIDIWGAMSGRWDHTLSTVMLLALPELRGCTVRVRDATQTMMLITDAAEITGQAGDTVSLLPSGGAAHGVTTRGLHYALHEATLSAERSRGVSNVLDESPAHVQVRTGALLCITTAQDIRASSSRQSDR